MEGDELPRDAETDAEAPRSAAFVLVERLEDAGERLRRDARARVAHGNEHASLVFAGTDHDAAAVSQSMKSGQVHIDLEFSLGGEAVRFWTSDLTVEYVRLNSEYTT